jgi:hypothetical protein
MITVKPTEEQKQEAIRRSKELGHIRNSIMQGTRNAIGFLGEIVVADILNAKHEGCKDYDMISKAGDKVECKTFTSTYKPKSNFECNVMAKSTHQQCDIYVFSGYSKKNSELYVCGYLKREDFYNKAKHVKKGDKAESNGLVYRSDGYIVTVGELNPIEDLL